ncbi:4Fe-4S ferredoxin [candidate division WOR-3 bacterium]|uniref:4Fe-4S ferredoxin n=1 Tax=candidate division WOR-3 bacterium TaxID=2052148 RepID=A0A660SJY6_UNCW3|nr:MAG: 4Fe-4S ferredoxin [candidate division WOR-3 bacterium]
MELRSRIRELFQKGEIGSLIGYGRGTLPLSARPIFITEGGVDQLIFDITCGVNLAKYLLRKKPIAGQKVGIICKGCDGRAIIQYLTEGQLNREDVYIIGISCPGMIDPNRVREKVRGRVVTNYQMNGEEITLSGDGFQLTLPREDLLSRSCLRCRYPSPPIYDTFIGSPKDRVEIQDEYRSVAEIESLPAAERWNYFQSEFGRCIRCYACRNSCPFCYCDVCFVDQTNPQWFGKGVELTDTIIFHLVRALHTAGRCVDCGSCERACPMGIKLTLLSKRMEREVRERFDYIPGLSVEETPPMAAYREDDPQEFIQ